MDQDVKFQPRRLGHVNLWVSDLEPAIAFYESVCGLELVRRERDLRIAFHSNGNTHHDIGMVEISHGQDRYGRDGTLQIPKTRGVAVGLNHLGWEMENEQALVQAYRRAQSAGFPIQRAVDHLISHSVYVVDPDGNGHEFYADEMHDWRTIYNLDREDEVTGLWDPLATPPKQESNYNVDPSFRRVDRAPLHPSHLTGVTFATRQFEQMWDFFTKVAGLHVVHEISAPMQQARFAGAAGQMDLTLLQAGPLEPVGLRSFRLRLNESIDAVEVSKALKASGVDLALAPVQEDGSAALAIRDPDGFRIEFFGPSA